MIDSRVLVEAMRRSNAERRPRLDETFAALGIDYDAAIAEMRLAREVLLRGELPARLLVHAAFMQGLELGVRAARLDRDDLVVRIAR